MTDTVLTAVADGIPSTPLNRAEVQTAADRALAETHAPRRTGR